MRWTTEEETFLKNNYSKHGINYCINNLNRSRKSIFSKCNLLQLKLNENLKFKINKESRKKSNNNKIDYLQFLNINKKEISYILGFIWADGFIYYEPTKKYKTKYIIGVHINSNDIDTIYPIFKTTGDWKLYQYKRFDKRTQKYYETSYIQICSENIVKFLIDNDYDKKSLVNPYKILNKIPNELKNHFYRGFSDGDGCYYIKNRVCQYAISGTFDQNWNWIENLLNFLKIKYNISYQKNKKSQSSKIRFTSIKDITSYSNYIYQNWNNIGLKRKHKKYLQILELIINN
jgi:hypothetical protein